MNKHAKINLAKPNVIYYLCCGTRAVHCCVTIITHSFSALRLFLVFISCTAVHFNTFADQKSDLADDYRIRGYEEQLKGNTQDALSWYFKAVSINPHDAAALNDVGLMFESLGMDDKAEESYLASIQADPDYLPAYANLGYFYKKNQNLGKAIVYFRQRAARGDPNDVWTQKAKGELKNIYNQTPFLKKKMVRHAADKLNRQLAEASRVRFHQQLVTAEKYYRQGLKLSRQRKYTEAIRIFDEALQLTPQNPKIIAARSSALHALNTRTVQEQVQQGLKLLKEGKNASARSRFREALTIIPNEGIRPSGK